jgi:hypothetical protein
MVEKDLVSDVSSLLKVAYNINYNCNEDIY